MFEPSKIQLPKPATLGLHQRWNYRTSPTEYIDNLYWAIAQQQWIEVNDRRVVNF